MQEVELTIIVRAAGHGEAIALEKGCMAPLAATRVWVESTINAWWSQ